MKTFFIQLRTILNRAMVIFCFGGAVASIFGAQSNIPALIALYVIWHLVVFGLQKPRF